MADETLSWLDEFFGQPTILEEGVALPKRTKINLIGTDVTATDDPTNKRTNVTLVGGPPVLNASTGALTAVPTTSGGSPARGVRFSGVAPTAHGLSSGTDGRYLVVSATGGPLVLAHDSVTETTAANRILSPTVTDVTIADEGSALLWYDGTSSRWRIVSTSSGGAPPFVIGTGTAPTTGELARFCSSVGAPFDTASLITWRRFSLAGDIALITVTDTSATSANVTYGGPTGTGSSTTLSGATARVTGTNQVTLSGGGAYGVWGPGGVITKGNWALGYADGLGGTFDTDGFGASAVGVGWIGTAINPPSHSAGGGMWFYCIGTKLNHRFPKEDNFRVGGTSQASESNRGYAQSLWHPDVIANPLNDSYSTRSEVLTPDGKAGSRTFFHVKNTAASGTIPGAFRFAAADETIVSVTVKVTMVRTTNATKAGVYVGKGQWRRTSGGNLTAVGTPEFVLEGETTAGDDVVFAIDDTLDEIKINLVSADTDPRRWLIELHVHEVLAT